MSLADPWIAALAALFLWWFSTGAILLVVRLADRMGGRAGAVAALAGLPLLGLGIWGYLVTLDGAGHAAAYHGFLAALAIWGWIELAFLTGLVTGPNLRPCPATLPEWERFLRAWGTVAYHEMALLAALLWMWIASSEAANAFGFWTFAVLYFARISAKLNLYFGVPRINTEFIPGALQHLPSHFRIRRANWLFPISVTALSFAVACWLERLFAVDAALDIVGFALLTAMTALALLEHWLMVVPLPDAKLWRWMLPAPKQTKGKVEGHHGF
ncbi:putative photosynthetic complex assembly protein PuhE [Lutimaribacter saemankumensis]|uniref:Putative photosynthetic complex assembly protein 2 n=1 Tax=Lutimaribacter saemankumensis TaxID=490829 RepID=A0A1G8SJ46_9RHOB|nr:putative photosynthetic complex assembly protein PuhE [Lutimaribacter saemankumensis]SDJ29183.1 putative photosynthetic complex assembly protein 2 [Lutimaribacter saemankumensis]